MKIERFEDIEAWQLVRELTQKYEECKTTNRDHKIQKVTDQKKSARKRNFKP